MERRYMHTRRYPFLVLAGLLSLGACDTEPNAPSEFRAPSFVTSSGNTVIITEADIVRQAENTPPTNEWVLYTRVGTGTGVFVAGPGTPPAGTGSILFSTPTGTDKVTLFNYLYVEEQLDELDALSYWTYRTAGSAQQVTALNIQVDVNGAAAGGFTTLVFEPVYNTTQGAVASDVWQEWDAYNGGNAIWWSSNPIPGAPNRDTFVSWNTILAENPDAVILGGLGFNQGSGNPALIAAADELTVGFGGETTTYDFELFKQAAAGEDCKNGGWESVKRADGSSFKNQGDCVSYVNNGK
jgi:hypothetical protein